MGVSEFTRQLAQASYGVETRVIPNGVDLELLNPGEIILNQPPRILFAGRFVTQKNPVQVVRALAGLRHLPWECVMVGDGPLRAAVETEIERQQLGKRFTLTGWITPDEVIEWFRQCDILFMPSLSEGLPVVGVQALAMGLAIVASRVGGFIDLVEPGRNGFLLDDHSEQTGVAALNELLSEPQKLLAFCQYSRQHARKFDITQIVENYERELMQVIS